jgi:type IV secretion system protein VirD4
MAEKNKISSLMQAAHEADLSYSIQYSGDGHLVTFAPTGSGKGVSAIIPNLLHYSGPCIVIDPKGENFRVTAHHRRSLGQEVLLLDPFKAIRDEVLSEYKVQRARLNPLDLGMLSGTTLENDAEMIADLLGDKGSLGSEPFWDLSAKLLIAGLIAHEMQQSRDTGVAGKISRIVDHLYANDPAMSIALMLDNEKPTPYVEKSLGGAVLSIDAKETRDGILATARSYVSTIRSKDIAESLENSTVDLGRIQEREDYTLYIVIPPTKLTSHSFLLKTWVAVLMHAVMERKRPPDKRTLFILDECANLGELDILRKAITLLRGYGLQVWMFFQDLSQMERLYQADFRTMINNCGVLQAFGINRLSSAAPLAELIGDYEPQDLLELDQTQQLLSVAPARVRVARLHRYYKDLAFKGRFADNPLIRKKTVRPEQSPLFKRQAKARL